MSTGRRIQDKVQDCRKTKTPKEQINIFAEATTDVKNKYHKNDGAKHKSWITEDMLLLMKE